MKNESSINAVLKKCHKQGLGVMFAAKAAKCSNTHASNIYYDLEMEKAKEAHAEKAAREFAIDDAFQSIGKRSNFVLCTNDQKVLNAYAAFAGKEYEP